MEYVGTINNMIIYIVKYIYIYTLNTVYTPTYIPKRTHIPIHSDLYE